MFFVWYTKKNLATLRESDDKLEKNWKQSRRCEFTTGRDCFCKQGEPVGRIFAFWAIAWANLLVKLYE
jgi:hypothetical protein